MKSLVVVAIAAFSLPVLAQHEHVGHEGEKPAAPTIFLDKSPRIVEYQLKRLSNEQLLLVERASNDKKYVPVFTAILTREGMSRAYRDEALASLVALNESNAVKELAAALRSVQGDDPSAQRMIQSLAAMLLELPQETLSDSFQTLSEIAQTEHRLLGPVGYAALIAAGKAEAAWEQAVQVQQVQRLLGGIALVPSSEARADLHSKVLVLTEPNHSVELRRSALVALAAIPAHRSETFLRAAEMIEVDELRDAAVRAMLSVPPNSRDPGKSLELIEWLLDFAEKTPAAERTETSFLDAMELVDQLIAKAPSNLAKSYRERLRETVVRVVRIHTVEEEMRYDTAYFAVEAGRPVQVVLINEDIMPHNLVVTVPGALQEVAELGLEVGPEGGLDGKQYVPPSDKVLFATDMVGVRAREALTFVAPEAPGEYPYVCTFPRHWMRMYGVMVVVEDLDAWQKNPVVPKDPIGSNRHFVQSWTIDDFKADIPNGMRGRSPHIGEKLFVEASCAQCHKAGAAGVGNVGPDLSDVFSRWKGDTAAVLQEILDPSHRIDEKYAVHLILTVDGLTVSGLIVEETKERISLMEDPEAKQPTVIPKADVEEMIKTSNSMMPKGLLDRYSKDEIFEILAFIQSVQVPSTPAK